MMHLKKTLSINEKEPEKNLPRLIGISPFFYSKLDDEINHTKYGTNKSFY